MDNFISEGVYMKIKTVVKVFLMIALYSQFFFSQSENKLHPNVELSDGLSNWIIDGTGLWKISHDELILYKAGKPSGPIRRPAALAILKTNPYKSVSIEADVKSTADTSVIRRDVDFIIDYNSPDEFYYIHLAGITDDVHNGIFIVNKSDRKRIDSGKGKPQITDNKWHHVKVVRNADNGNIKVFVDASKQPVLQANDLTFMHGQIGVGSFDDTGKFKNIVVQEN